MTLLSRLAINEFPLALKSVTEHPNYSRRWKIKCPVLDLVTIEERRVTAVECRSISSISGNNEACADFDCPSKWSACSRCVETGRTRSQTGLVNRETGRCSKHPVIVTGDEEPLRKTKDHIPREMRMRALKYDDSFGDDISVDDVVEEVAVGEKGPNTTVEGILTLRKA